MLWGMATAFLSAINMIVYKKLLILNSKTQISSIGLYGCMCIMVVVLLGIFYAISPTSITSDLNKIHTSIFIIIGVIIFSLLGIVANIPAQEAYKREKISVLAPFAQTGSIITLILGFFLFSNTSLGTFLFALLGAGALVGSSIDFKSFTINKYCFLILLSGVIGSINTIIAGYIILELSSISFIFTINAITAMVVVFYIIVFKKGELTKIGSGTTYPLFGMLTLNNFLWLISYMITLYLMKEVGVVMTSLLGMTTMALTIASSYIFFHDIPKKKDIVVTMIIIGCIIGGTAF